MILKIGAKFEEKPNCCFKNDKIYNVLPKKVQRSYIS